MRRRGGGEGGKEEGSTWQEQGRGHDITTKIHRMQLKYLVHSLREGALENGKERSLMNKVLKG